MKNLKIISIILILALVAVFASSCGTGNLKTPEYLAPDMAAAVPSKEGGDDYLEITENPFVKASEQPSSMFALSVSTAAYSNLRRYVNNNYPINKNQINIEQIVNYFRYDYADPADNKPLSVTPSLFSCPWNEDARLLTVGLKAETVQADDVKNNLVFLLDVSGSMSSPDKIGLMKEAFILLLENLDENDTVSIVTYAGSDKLLLDGANGAEKTRIAAVIEDLSAGGSTAGARGITTAYQLAQKYFIQGGNNRVILATDGDFNVGVSSNAELNNLISQKRQTGVYLTALGFGYGNLQNDMMQTLANNGNGTYAYIDTITEARKVLVEEIGGTLNVVARDAKARVNFNADYIDSYRLLGYENLLLSEEQWQNTETDAGEIGSGFTVTAVYEVIFRTDVNINTEGATFLDTVIRYKSPNVANEEQQEIKVFCKKNNIYAEPTRNMTFISALVETCLLLRDSQYKGTANMTNVNSRLEAMDLSDDTYMQEFRTLAQKIAAQYFSNNA